MGTEYYASERFIHDDLLVEAADSLPVIHRWWRDRGRIPPFLITWPEEAITCDDGSVVDDKFSFSLPEDPSQWKDLIQQAVKRTKAYALLLGSQREDEVRLIFESQHGTKSWHFAIEEHGPDKILVDPTTKVDECYVGLLWRPSSPKPEEQ